MSNMEYSYKHIPCLDEFQFKNDIHNAYTTKDLLERAMDFEFKSSDIVICTFPRSGTTLTQEMTWQIKNRESIVLGEKYEDLDIRFPFLEFNNQIEFPGSPLPIELLEMRRNDPFRLIKTHMHYELLKPKLDVVNPKIIYVYRNPKDVAVSMYHFYKGLDLHGPWEGTWPDFLNIFVNENTFSGGYFQNNLEWFDNLSKKKNALFLKYEDIVRNPYQTVFTIARFVDEGDITDEQAEIVVKNSNFKSMFTNKNINFMNKTGFTFIRKGMIGDWKNMFTANQNAAFESYIDSHIRNRNNIAFQFD